MRPKLHPYVPITWRNATTLQIGLSPEPTALITNASNRTLSMINSLDGVSSVDEIRKQFDKAREGESPQAPTFDEVLSALNAAHALVDTANLEIDPYLPQQFRERLVWQVATQDLLRPKPDSGSSEIRRRKSSYVAVNGADPLALATAHLLALAGVDRVVLDAPEHLQHKVTAQTFVGLGPSWSRIGEAAILATREMLMELDCKVTRPRGLAEPGCEVFSTWPTQAERDRVHAQATPYLILESFGVGATVGPMVLPGASPCARCIELANARVDPYWSSISTQVGDKPNGSTEGLVDAAVIAWAASVAVMSVTALLARDANPACPNPLVGRRLFLRCPGPEMRQVTLDLESACGCTG